MSRKHRKEPLTVDQLEKQLDELYIRRESLQQASAVSNRVKRILYYDDDYNLITSYYIPVITR